jgi:hypothetical protein
MAANAVHCLSQQGARPGAEGFHCLAEATGFCSNPVDRFTKDLKDSLFAGVKVGTECDIGGSMATSWVGWPYFGKFPIDACHAFRHSRIARCTGSGDDPIRWQYVHR